MSSVRTQLAVARETRRLLTAEGSWCQHEMFLNANGSKLSSVGTAAHNFNDALYRPDAPWIGSRCLSGALHTARHRLGGGDPDDPVGDRLNAAAIRRMEGSYVEEDGSGAPFVDFNDTKGRTHEEILALLDDVIADLRRKVHDQCSGRLRARGVRTRRHAWV